MSFAEQLRPQVFRSAKRPGCSSSCWCSDSPHAGQYLISAGTCFVRDLLLRALLQSPQQVFLCRKS